VVYVSYAEHLSEDDVWSYIVDKVRKQRVVTAARVAKELTIRADQVLAVVKGRLAGSIAARPLGKAGTLLHSSTKCLEQELLGLWKGALQENERLKVSQAESQIDNTDDDNHVVERAALKLRESIVTVAYAVRGQRLWHGSSLKLAKLDFQKELESRPAILRHFIEQLLTGLVSATKDTLASKGSRLTRGAV
jgi:hypothetical protein